jgi:hypothetical protein
MRGRRSEREGREAPCPPHIHAANRMRTTNQQSAHPLFLPQPLHHRAMRDAGSAPKTHNGRNKIGNAKRRKSDSINIKGIRLRKPRSRCMRYMHAMLIRPMPCSPVQPRSHKHSSQLHLSNMQVMVIAGGEKGNGESGFPQRRSSHQM